MTISIGQKLATSSKYWSLISFLAVFTSNCQSIRNDAGGVSNVSVASERRGDNVSSSSKRMPVGAAHLVGKFEQGILQAGGETTGTIVRIGDVVIELDLSFNLVFQKAAEALDGEVVRVRGKLLKGERVDGNFRWILLPDVFEGYEITSEHQLQVAFFGNVSRTSAFGGETTGHVIDIDGVKLELELNERQSNVTDKLERDEKVAVVGYLIRKKGTEIKNRWIVQVSQIDESKDLLWSFRRTNFIDGVVNPSSSRRNDYLNGQ